MKWSLPFPLNLFVNNAAPLTRGTICCGLTQGAVGPEGQVLQNGDGCGVLGMALPKSDRGSGLNRRPLGCSSPGRLQ